MCCGSGNSRANKTSDVVRGGPGSIRMGIHFGILLRGSIVLCRVCSQGSCLVGGFSCRRGDHIGQKRQWPSG